MKKYTFEDFNDPSAFVERKLHDPEFSDSNVRAVTEMMKKRMEFGLKKYGVNTERTDLGILDFLQHLQEELCDAAIYVERLKKDLSKK